MARFRKKPVVIDAVQFRGGEQSDELAADATAGRIKYCEDGTMLVDTLEGSMIARPGDWIIRGVKGELYPCKPDIFAATYENADAPTESREHAINHVRMVVRCLALELPESVHAEVKASVERLIGATERGG